MCRGMMVTNTRCLFARALERSAMMVSSAATLARWNALAHLGQADEPQRRRGRQAVQFGLKPAVGVGDFIVASPGRPLGCPGQDFDQSGVPLYCLFHGERLAEERARLYGTNVRCRLPFCALSVRSKFCAGEKHRWKPVADDIWDEQMSRLLRVSFLYSVETSRFLASRQSAPQPPSDPSTNRAARKLCRI